MPDPVRLLHVSDVHVTRRPRLVRDFAPKRLTGWATGIVTGRRRKFRHAAAVLDVLRREIAARRPDAVVFTGDATTLALHDEFDAAAAGLGVLDPNGPVGVAVPGNHDVYTASAAGRFEAAFAPWQVGERVGDHHYPFARRVGAVWLVAVNSARTNRRPADSTGEIGAAQLLRLRELCARLAPGPRLVVTHYPLTTAAGEPEPRNRRLVDHAAAAAAAVDSGVAAWLHGHIHAGFMLFPSATVPVLRLCPGSATQRGRLTVCEYMITGAEVRGAWRAFVPAAGAFRVVHTFAARLAGSGG